MPQARDAGNRLERRAPGVAEKPTRAVRVAIGDRRTTIMQRTIDLRAS
jgi:hypothetical protein